MNRRFSILLVCLLCSATMVAQSSIVDDLNKPKYGQGEVRIYQDDAIKNIVALSKQPTISIVTQSDNSRSKTYKIQIFSGNDQRQSKDEAYSKRDEVKARFPQLPVRITFDPPTWRVLVGNFDNNDDAQDALIQLRSAFPSFGREMYIVQ